jgi:hypothetical protein
MHDAGTGDEYGLLGEILGVDKYDHQTGISTYVEEMKPDTYDGTIDATNPRDELMLLSLFCAPTR